MCRGWDEGAELGEGILGPIDLTSETSGESLLGQLRRDYHSILGKSHAAQEIFLINPFPWGKSANHFPFLDLGSSQAALDTGAGWV